MAKMKKEHGEQGSIVAMYHIIGLGADVGLSPTGKARTKKWENWMEKELPSPPKNNSSSFDDMIGAFDSFLPSNNNVYTTKESPKGPIFVNALWVNTWINQALVIKDTINGNGWKYGWFDSKGQSFKGIPPTKISHTMECIWDDIFAKNQDINSEFNSKKDNWDPADTYLIKESAEKTIHGFCDDLLEQFLSVEDKVKLDDPDLMKRFVGSVNMELCKLVNDGDLVPISLKKQTTKVTMSAKKTNLQSIPGGDLGEVRGWFTGQPYCYCDIVSGKKGVNEIDFKGNSFYFKCHIKLGGYGNDYQIEQRMQGKSPDKAEIKDIRKTDGGNTKAADAQVGQVPTEKFKELIKKWANVNSYNHNIPKVGVPFTDIQLQYWADEMDAISKERLSLGENGGTTTIDLGKFEILGTSYTARNYWALLGRLDNAGDSATAIGTILGENLEKGNFSAKMRNRCHQLRFMRALVNAYNSKMIVKGKGEAQLCMLLVRLYYLAAKMKMKDDDLQGPFYKVA
tara:strand:+ start:231 stop:1763 length:1533 start_codon:yes stop_codon:yes gene_type:complete